MSALAAGLPQLTATVGTSLETVAEGVVVEHPSRDHLTHAEAVALTAEIRSGLRDLAAMLDAVGQLIGAAWAMRADVTLGYPSWESYCADLFADVRATRLPVPRRRALVLALRTAGMSTRAAGAALGVDQKTISNDLRAAATEETSSVEAAPGTGTGDTASTGDIPSIDRPATVTGLDGRQRPATSTRTPRPRRATTGRVVDLLAAAGDDGLTVRDVGRRLRLHHGQASGALSRLEAQGRVARTGQRRGGCAVYVATAPAEQGDPADGAGPEPTSQSST